jgi:hypothetical protein
MDGRVSIVTIPGTGDEDKAMAPQPNDYKALSKDESHHFTLRK